MECNSRIKRSTWSPRLILALLGLVVAVGPTGCSAEVEPVEGEPDILWWYYQDAATGDEGPFRTAMLLAEEGWNGSRSSAPQLALFSQIYSNGSLLIELGLHAPGHEARCPDRGCYLYARHPQGEWQILRATPRDEERKYLVLSNPWTLYDLAASNSQIEIEVPLLVPGSCTYTLWTHGYRADLHKPSSKAISLNGDGSPREDRELTDEDRARLEGPPEEDTVWPMCSGAGT